MVLKVNDHKGIQNAVRERLLEDLGTDAVITLGQLCRRYFPDVPKEEVRRYLLGLASSGAITIWPAWIPATARSRKPVRVDLVATRHLALPPPSLRHMCGVAEMRWILRERIVRWSVTGPHFIGDTEEPDALGEDVSGIFAVEYDAGAYSREQIRRKGETFLKLYGRQVWGTPSPARVERLKAILPRGATVVEAPWY